MSTIENKLKRTPVSPGVYLLKDENDVILYVGKAKQLRNRLRSHFKPGKQEDAKHQRLMQRVRDFETILTDSEVEALIMEANFVKEHSPRYNIDLKDDKSYPFIRVTNGPFPKIFITRKMVQDGSIYFGPYTDAGALRQLMNAVRKIFPLRTCNHHLSRKTEENKKDRECLNFHIGRCSGACSGRISHEEYEEIVAQAVAFIKGKDSNLIKDLRQSMATMAEQQRYEKAAVLRDEIKSITAFRNKQKVVDPDNTDRDLISIAADKGEACGVVFNVREGKIINRQHFFLKNSADSTSVERNTAFIKQFYLESTFIPSEIFIRTGIEEQQNLETWLSKKKGQRIKIIVPKIGRKAKLMEMCTENAKHLLSDYFSQKEAAFPRISGPVEALKKDLGLEDLPMRIEAFDISNIQGVDSVASMVVFENGKPKKSEYRKYKIKTVAGADDFASMAEVLNRRIARLLREEKPFPDLFMVDGGKGQLSAAVDILRLHGIEDQPIIGLAKKLEEVFIPGFSDPQNIPKHSPGLHLLQRVRDEAHRFAITFHRELRKKRTIHSVLDDIPGIGKKRRAALLKTFGSIQKLEQAGIEKIAVIPGINLKVARVVKESLLKQKVK